MQLHAKQKVSYIGRNKFESTFVQKQFTLEQVDITISKNQALQIL